MKNKTKWKKLSSKMVYENKWMKVHEDKVINPGGEEGVYAIVNKMDATMIIAKDIDGIYLIRHYRYVLKQELLEIPAGGLDEGETPEDAARRELLEETGIKAGKITVIGQLFPAVSSLAVKHYVALAEELDISGLSNEGESDEEILEVFKKKN